MLRSGFEIARPVEVRDEPGLLRLLAKRFPSSMTRGQVVDRCERRKPAKVVGCFLGGLADNRHVQAAAKRACDLSEGHAFFGDPVIPRSCGTLLQHEPVEMRNIEPVDSRPAVEPFAQIRRDALFTPNPNKARNKP